MAQKERKVNNKFSYDANNTDYDFQLKKRPNLWWLLLLLLPLLLLVPLKKDIRVYTKVDGKAEPFVDVSMNYMARYLLWGKKFNVKMPYDTIQQTDSTGCTVFKNLGYSVYSFLFHRKSAIVFAVEGSSCYDDVEESRRFHSTRRVELAMAPNLADVRLKVVDAELGFALPDAKVNCEYSGKGGSEKVKEETDAAGYVVIKEAKVCGEFKSIMVSADGYADTLLTNVETGQLLGGCTIPLRPLKDRLVFYVKNLHSKEPVPDALAEVSLMLGQQGTVGKSRTNVDGIGQGFFDNARVLAEVGIKVTKQGYYDSVFVSPSGHPNPITVRDFVKLPDGERVVWLRPKPQTCEFRNVDTLSLQPIAGVRNEIVIEGVNGSSRTEVQVSNRNGVFAVTAFEGDKVTITSTLDPYYHPQTTVIGSFAKSQGRPQEIYMRPVLVNLMFRTMEMAGGHVTGVLPDCDLAVTVDGIQVNPTTSGSGTFNVGQLRLNSKISIVASKQGYESNRTKVRDKSVEILFKSGQDERDIPLAPIVPVLKSCDEKTVSGSNNPESFVFNMGQKGGTFVLDYNTGNIYPDRIIVYDGNSRNGKEIWSFEGTTDGTQQSKPIKFTQSEVFIEIIPNGDSGTSWDIAPHCPQ